MNKKIISLILMGIVILALTGCSKTPKCIKSHTESKVVPVTMIINKRPIVVMRTQVITICDEYEYLGE
jgi:starvation-inducible outer membrane lipoprotein|nr:MAG TPA: putative peptidyl-prolyl cis-trans isomerase [Bacteriophage sp.]